MRHPGACSRADTMAKVGLVLGMRGTLVGAVSFHAHFWIDTFMSDRLTSPGGNQRNLLNLAHRFTMGACSETLYLDSSVVQSTRQDVRNSLNKRQACHSVTCSLD